MYASSYCIPIVNISDTELTEKEERVLSFGLEHSFVDKNKNIKSFLAANLEGVAESADKAVGRMKKRTFTSFYTRTLICLQNNVHNTKISPTTILKDWFETMTQFLFLDKE